MPANPLPGAMVNNNSFIYWDLQKADGEWFSLHTYAWSVSSFGGRRFFTGAKRGEDLSLPYRVGRIWTPKSREAQNYDINMWVFPFNADGSVDPTKTVEQKADENFRKIVSAVDQEGQFRLRKRWYGDTASRTGFESGQGVQSAIAMAEFLDGSGPSSDDGRDFYMDLSFTLADPYFYGRHIHAGYTSTQFVASATTLVPGTNNIPREGDAPSPRVFIEITLNNNYPNALANPRIQFPDGNWLELQAHSLPDKTGTVVIDCQKGLVVRSTLKNYLDGVAFGTVLNGRLKRNPQFTAWPKINPTTSSGATLPIVASGNGTIKLAYDPAYR